MSADQNPTSQCPAKEGPSKCTWTPKAAEQGVTGPHTKVDFASKVDARKTIMPTILDAIGMTPLVRLNKIPQSLGIECEVLAKCEYLNAGGSVKDRIGKRMVEDAEKSGRIKKGDTLIEPTSGNTGIGLALAAAIKGYKMIITLPEKMSQEKVDVLKALGAQIIRTPTEAAWDSPESHIGVAKRLNEEIPNSHILDQYGNPSNPLAHYDETAEEILLQTGGKVDVVVMSAGTGGTLTGIARKLREKLPNVKVIGVDPHGSILAQPESLNARGLGTYKVEGIGYDFIPNVLERNMVDEWIKTDDKESFIMARRLIREEGMLCGGSSGSALAAALQVAKQLGPGQRLVVLLPDSVRNYMSKFLNDDWMSTNDFSEVPDSRSQNKEAWMSHTVANLRLASPFTVAPTVSCGEAVELMKKHGFDQLPVVDADKGVLGTVTEGNILAQLVSRRVTGEDPVSKVLYKQFQQITKETPLRDLSRIFDRDHFALVISTEGSKKVVHGVVTRIDLLNYVISVEKKQGTA